MKRKIWARLGATIIVDEELFVTEPKRAITEAILVGNVRLDGETYLPDLGENEPHCEREFDLDLNIKAN